MRAGSCLTTGTSRRRCRRRRLTHHAVVNILTFIRRWREILIQPCFTDSVALTTQIHPHIDRISGVRSRIPVKLNTITIDRVQYSRSSICFASPLESVITGSMPFGAAASDHHQRNRRQNDAPIFRDSVHLAPNLPGNRPMPVRVAITRANGQ